MIASRQRPLSPVAGVERPLALAGLVESTAATATVVLPALSQARWCELAIRSCEVKKKEPKRRARGGIWLVALCRRPDCGRELVEQAGGQTLKTREGITLTIPGPSLEDEGEVEGRMTSGNVGS